MALGPGDIIQIAALCLQIYDTFNGVREKAPAEFQKLADDYDQFNSVFQEFYRLERRSLREPYRLRPYIGWKALAATLARCEAFLEKWKVVVDAGWSKEKFLRTAKWPFTKDDIQTLRTEIKDHAMTLGLHIHTVCAELNLEVFGHVQRISSAQAIPINGYQQRSAISSVPSSQNPLPELPSKLPSELVIELPSELPIELPSEFPVELPSAGTRGIDPGRRLGTASSDQLSSSYDTYGSMPAASIEHLKFVPHRRPVAQRSYSLDSVVETLDADTTAAKPARIDRNLESKGRSPTDYSDYSSSSVRSRNSTLNRSPRQSGSQEDSLQRNWNWDAAKFALSPVLVGSPAMSLRNGHTPNHSELGRQDLPPPALSQPASTSPSASDWNLEQYQSTNGSPGATSSVQTRSSRYSQTDSVKRWTPLGYKAILGFTHGTKVEKLICGECKSSSRIKPCVNILSSRESSSAAVVIRATCERSGEIILELHFTRTPTSYTKHTLLCATEKLRVFFKDTDPSSLRLIMKGVNAEKLPFVELMNKEDHKAFQEMLHGEELLCSCNVNSFKTNRGIDRSQSLRLWRDKCSGELKILFWASLKDKKPGKFWKVSEADVSLQRKVSRKDPVVKLIPVKAASPKWKFNRRPSTCSQSSDSTGSSNPSSTALSSFDELEIEFDTAEDRKKFLEQWDANCRGSA